MASDLGLSQRVVRYRLGSVESFLGQYDLQLVRRRGAGLYVDFGEERAAIEAELDLWSGAQRVNSPDERDHVVIAKLLSAAPEPISLEQLQEDLHVSKASARRDVKRVEPWLERRGLPLIRRPGVGIHVAGSELAIRRALVRWVLQAVPEDVLHELVSVGVPDRAMVGVKLPAGVLEHVDRLQLRECARLLSQTSLAWTMAQGNSERIFTIYLAVSAHRISVGRVVSMEAGQLRSLADHPVSETAAGIAVALGELIGEHLPDREVAGLTEYLLGLVNLADAEQGGSSPHAGLLDELLERAGEQLHPALALDPELRRSLLLHLERLAIRLRYGLPVYNPLMREVAARYPEVHDVALSMGEIIRKHLGAAVPEDEVGFVTMYLSGAMERAHLRPRVRVLVVCPSGMATAWILVSRIQAEFPQLELAGVVPVSEVSGADTPAVDLIIATTEVGPGPVPAVVVSPFLSETDIGRIAQHVH